MDEKRAALLASSAASFMTPFMGAGVNIAMPQIGAELAMDAVSLGWVATSYLLAAAAVLVPFGRAADIVGRKRIFLLGILVHVIASLLMTAAQSGVMLIAFRALQGIGGGMMFGTGVAILVTLYPPLERGRVLGINTAAVYLGLSLGPFAGGLLTHAFGWRSIFFIVAAIGLGVYVLVRQSIHSEWAHARGERFDTAGALVYAGALLCLMYGFSVLPSAAGIGLVGGGIAGLVLFVFRESASLHPLMDTRLFRNNSVYLYSNLAALINYCATFAVTFLLSLYLQYVKGMNPQTAGFHLVAQPVLMTLVSPLAGRLSDRIEPRIVSSIGMGCIAIGLVLCAAIDARFEIAYLIPILALLGTGFGLFSSPNTNAVMSSVDRASYSIASATLGTMRLTGQMLSMGIVILIFATNIGRVAITTEYHPRFLAGMKTAFVIFAVLCVLGVFASLVRGRVRNGRES